MRKPEPPIQNTTFKMDISKVSLRLANNSSLSNFNQLIRYETIYLIFDDGVHTVYSSSRPITYSLPVHPVHNEWSLSVFLSQCHSHQ